MNITLRISGEIYLRMRDHLFPGDGKESVAIALCGNLTCGDEFKMLVHQLIPIPTTDCKERTPNKITWSTERLRDVLELANKKKFSILKIHSHPTGYPQFSEVDNHSDRELFDSMFSWIDDINYHASAVMLPDGRIFARSFDRALQEKKISKIAIVDSDLKFFFSQDPSTIEDYSLRTAQAFGNATTSLLRELKIAVIGCSGTGSPTIEQLYRLGVGTLLLVDPDKIEKKNLNRILNSSVKQAKDGAHKVDVLKDAIIASGLNTDVLAYRRNLYDSVELLKEIASCDIIFGCMDSVDGRHVLNQLATFYIVPYFDLGVKLSADGKGGIEQIWGTVHYILPGGSSLRTRGVYDLNDLHAASLYRRNPTYYGDLKKEGYIKNVAVDSPAVISVNMLVSSMAIMEMLARLHKHRPDNNRDSAITRVSLTDCYIQKEAESEPDTYLQKFVGSGDVSPFLNMPELSIT